MKLEEQGLVYDATGRPTPDRIAFQIALCRTSQGTILATFQVGPKKHAPTATLRVCRSRDSGRTWSELPWRFETMFSGVPGSLVAGEMVETEPGRLLLIASWFDRSDPMRPVFDPVTEGVLRAKQLIAVSGDEGDTWSAWRELPIQALRGCTITGPILQWPDGMIGYAFESYKEFDEPGPKRHGAWIILSRDGGRTFGEPILVAHDPAQRIFFWDQRLGLGASGEIIGMYWTHHLGEKRDLNVHLRRFTLANNDWRAAPLRETTISGQIGAPLWLTDGRLLAFVVNRGRPGRMTLWCSRDGGQTWPEHLDVHVQGERARASDGKANVNYVQYWEDMGKWSFGHPAIRSLGAGKVLLAWYAGVPGSLNVHWARVMV